MSDEEEALPEEGGRGRRGGRVLGREVGAVWALGGMALWLWVGTVLVGGPWAGFHAMLLGLVGVWMWVFPPRVALPVGWWVLAGVVVIGGLAPLLPAGWFAMPGWRAGLDAAGVETGLRVAMQPGQVVEGWMVVVFMVVVLLWMAGHRVEGLRLRVLALAFVGGVAGYAVLARVMMPPPVSDLPGGGVVYGFFPNRNHTGSYLVMGSLCGLGCIFQAIRRRRWLELGLGLVATGVCVGAVLGWSISRGSVVLVGLGGVLWMWLVGVRYLGRTGRWAVALVVLLVGGFFAVSDTAAKRRLVATVGQVGGLAGGGEVATGLEPGVLPKVETPVDLDFRIPILLDSVGMVRDFPWTGIGMGQFYHVFPQYRRHCADRNDSDVFHPDNDWLWWWIELGPAAALALVALVGWGLVAAGRGVLVGRARALRAGCLVAAAMLAVHGLFDVPGHRVTLAWSAGWLFALSLGGVRGRPAGEGMRWVFRGLGMAMLGVALWLGWAQWFGGPVPSRVAGEVAVERALALYREDLGRREAAEREGLVYAPVAGEDLLEEALRVLAEASRRVPLDREVRHVSGLLAVQFDDKLELAERAFAAGRALDPLWVSGPLRQASALGALRPERAGDLWNEALERAGRVDRVKAGTPWGREYTLQRIRRAVRENPELERWMPEGG